MRGDAIRAWTLEGIPMANGFGLSEAGRVVSIVGPKLGGIPKSAGHSPSQLMMDLLPIAIAGSICALLLASYTQGGETHS
jgi:hypothetical protein